jgi:ribonuclease-3
VLGCAVADELYARFPQLPEGKLTRLRAGLVREEALAEVGERLGLRGLLRVEPSTPLTPSILADAVEALVGAVFLDAGYAAARATVLASLGPLIDSLDPAGPAKDAKTELQEALQARRQPLPDYRIVSVRGAAHQQSFEVECALPALGLSTSGSGTSRQRAEQQAAQAMLARIDISR